MRIVRFMSIFSRMSVFNAGYPVSGDIELRDGSSWF